MDPETRPESGIDKGEELHSFCEDFDGLGDDEGGHGGEFTAVDRRRRVSGGGMGWGAARNARHGSLADLDHA